MRTWTLAAAVLVGALLAGCGDGERVEDLADPASTPARTLAERVHDPDAILYGAVVASEGDGYAVRAAWGLPSGKGRAITSSDDGFATATYARWRPRAMEWPVPPMPQVDGLEGLLAQSATSFAAGVQAVTAGSDGATLAPLERTARSTDGGRTWTVRDVPRTGGEMPYVNGELVLPDGRLVVLIGNWSDDTFRKPAARHHGFWVSVGDDWTRFRPYEPTFTPALTPDPDGWAPVDHLGSTRGGDLVWAQTRDSRIYVTRDGARFEEIPVRPPG